jgi:hypothetical protein
MAGSDRSATCGGSPQEPGERPQVAAVRGGCCRRIWKFITDAQCRAVLEITERSADAPVDVEAVLALH